MNEYKGYTPLFSEKTYLLKKFDQAFLKMLDNYKVNEWIVPALIDGTILERCGYFSTLPNHLTKVAVIKRDRLQAVSEKNEICCCSDFDNTNDLYLTPAACLHIYPMIEQNPIYNEIVTTYARVYRYENGNFKPLERQWDFTVREFVAVGDAEYVIKFLADLENKLLEYASSIYKNVAIEDSNDHFYPTRQNKLKEKFQLKNNLKRELVAYYGESRLAISSFNYHEYHFSKEFNFDDNEKIVTGCVGCGLERWVCMTEMENL